ncbi:MAG TPA: hypothetical protein VGQ04_05710, partial [Chitinophagaceae bacterium]|nr:hypothetical protein [Chitinophagaceae bacterium]
MKPLILSLLIVIAPAIRTNSQGCVAIRNVAGISPDLLFENIQPNDKVIFNITNRYFEASKSFRTDTVVSDTLVTNRIYTLNFSIIRLLKNGWSITLNVPIAANSRNNGADHMGPLSYPKHTTHAFGLGDIRLTVYKWLLNPSENRKGNIQAGLGIKLPTGDFKYQDYFYRKADSTVLAPVDQAIQLGDGGTGITTELSAFYSLGRKINLYFQGFYLINPREQNGVSNLKGRAPTRDQTANNTTVMSVPDQYSLRGGANFQFQKIILTAGLRYEKVPENDLIGGNKGFRRAATIASVEPGITYKMKNSLAFVYIGIPFERNIIQNK